MREEVEKLELEEEGGRWLGCERRARTVRYNCVPRMCRLGGRGGGEGEGEERRWSKDGVGRRGSWGLGRETSLARPPRPVGEGAQNNAHKM